MTADPIGLIRDIARGDREAFQRFYDRYATLVFTFALRILRVRSEAEELLQEVFLQIWNQAEDYDQKRGSPEAWIITITRSRAINRLRDIQRRQRGVVPLEESSTHSEGTAQDGSSASQARVMVKSALVQLSEPQRRVLELAYFEGLTQSEIAARLDEPLGTIKTRIRDGLERLRGLMGARDSSEP
jgi:RNA polymerase sigma-70 factor (ECF subfamily)